MTAIVDTAIEAAGLSDVLALRARARASGTEGDAARRALDALAPRLEHLDLLVLGALADRIRAAEAGDVVRIFAGVAPDEAEDVVVVDGKSQGDAHTGLGFLRRVAAARVTGPFAARVRVDWHDVGLELAQVALGFGASELTGAIANKRGLPIAEGAMSGTGKKSALEPMLLVKRRELAGFVTRSGRVPRFATPDGGLEALSVEEVAAAHAERTRHDTQHDTQDTGDGA